MQDTDYSVAKKYSSIKYNFAIFEMCFTFILLLIIQFSGLSHTFRSFAAFFSSKEIVIIAIYAIVLGGFTSIFTIWLDYFSGYKLEHKFELSCQNLSSWIKDYLKKAVMGGIFYIIIIQALYFFLRRFPSTWWVWTAFFYLFFSLFIARIFPVFIIPLFYKLEKLKDEGLKDKLLALAKKTGIRVLDIYRIGLSSKTKKANAALAGIGSSKRILLSDTLLDNYSSEEIEATLAHELAHYKYRHIWKLILINFITTVVTFLFIYILFSYILTSMLELTLSDIRAFPMLAFIFMFFNIAITPLLNAVSRRFELQADAEAIRLTKNPEAFISLMEKLSKQNLSDPDPSKAVEAFFYNHPPAPKRIKAVKALG